MWCVKLAYKTVAMDKIDKMCLGHRAIGWVQLRTSMSGRNIGANALKPEHISKLGG